MYSSFLPSYHDILATPSVDTNPKSSSKHITAPPPLFEISIITSSIGASV
jgi:hypothetical protein